MNNHIIKLFKGIGILLIAFLIILVFGLLFLINYKKDPNGYVIKANNIFYEYEYDGDIICDSLEGIADIKTFEIINDSHAKDKNNVWFEAHIIKGADIKTFTVFLENGYYYSKDKNYVYKNAEALPYAKPNTFEWLEYKYSKDKYHVYFEDKLVNLAKPQSFKCISNGNGYAKDDEHVFYQGELMEDIDVKTFTIKNNITYDNDGSRVTHTDSPIVNDNRSFYHKGKKILPLKIE